MKYSAQVIDLDTMEAVPNATVELWYNNILLRRILASKNGSFAFDVTAIPDQVRVSSASYKPASFPFSQVQDDSYLPMEKNIVEGENVIVTAVRRHPWLWFALITGLLVLADKNKNR